MDHRSHRAPISASVELPENLLVRVSSAPVGTTSGRPEHVNASCTTNILKRSTNSSVDGVLRRADDYWQDDSLRCVYRLASGERLFMQRDYPERPRHILSPGKSVRRKHPPRCALNN